MSKFLNLDYKDVLKGAVVSLLAILLKGLQEIFQDGRIPNVDEASSIGWVALSAGFSYLIKNLFTNSSGEIFTREKENVD
jgi:hypothetical protein